MQSFPNIEEMIYKAGPITNCMKIIEKICLVINQKSFATDW